MADPNVIAEADAPAPVRAAPERSAAYQWLAGLFAREPSVETLALYRSPEGLALLEHLAALEPLAPLIEALRGVVEPIDAALDTRARDLSGAYAWLFYGVAGPRSAPPYASAYTSENGRLFGEATARSAAVLERLGLRVAERFKEPPDHVAVLLSLMSELAGRAEPYEQADFLAEHILPWIGEFRDRCAAADRHGFYAMAARCLAEFAESDHCALSNAT